MDFGRDDPELAARADVDRIPASEVDVHHAEAGEQDQPDRAGRLGVERRYGVREACPVADRLLPTDALPIERQSLAAIVRATADVGGKAVAVIDRDLGRRRRVAGKHNAAEHRVDGNLAQGTDCPVGAWRCVGEVADADLRQRLRVAVRRDENTAIGPVEACRVVVKFPPSDGLRHVGARGQMIERGTRGRLVEQRHVRAERAEQKAARVHPARGLAGDRIGIPAPDPGADIGNVEPPRPVQGDIERRAVGIGGIPLAGSDTAHVDRPAGGLERAAEPAQRRAVAQIGVAAGLRTQMMQALVDREAAEILDHPHRPRGHVGAQLLERDDGALAPAVADSVGDLGTATRRARHAGQQRRPADEIADIGHDPGRASLDEFVAVKAAQILLQHADLLGDDPEQRLQLRARRRVAGAVDRRKERVNLLGAEAH